MRKDTILDENAIFDVKHYFWRKTLFFYFFSKFDKKFNFDINFNLDKKFNFDKNFNFDERKIN